MAVVDGHVVEQQESCRGERGGSPRQTVGWRQRGEEEEGEEEGKEGEKEGKGEEGEEEGAIEEG